MDFKNNVVIPKVVSRSEHRIGKIHYENEKFYAILSSDKILELTPESIDITNSKSVYSTPENTNYCEWMPKQLLKVLGRFNKDSHSIKVISKYWSKYADGDKVYGDIIERDGIEYFSTIISINDVQDIN